MKVLVANIGSTSFKYRVYEMDDETLLARGTVERIGSEESVSTVYRPDGSSESVSRPVPDHGAAVAQCLEQLCSGRAACLASMDEVSAIGFKAVQAKGITGVVRIDEEVLRAMDEYAAVAPAHNPPYTTAMRALRARLPQMTLVAAFEPNFHADAPEAFQRYAVPEEWVRDLGIRRYGFHGASHRYIAQRTAELLANPDARIISCHLGGSSSLCGIRAGKSLGASHGFSPQSGITQNNRVGDVDPFILPVVMKAKGWSVDEVLHQLAEHAGLEALSGAGRDLRDIEQAAAAGDERAQLALDVYVHDIRRWLGAFLVELGGAEALVFTGGIGENSTHIRATVCRDLHELGIVLDSDRNASAKGECCISAEDSRVQIWTVPTNEEIIVARQTAALL